MDKLDKHKNCGKCIEQFEINKSKQDGTYKEIKTKILGVFIYIHLSQDLWQNL